MDQKQKTKTHIEPEFTLVRIDEQNKLFFAASGGPEVELPTIQKVYGSW